MNEASTVPGSAPTLEDPEAILERLGDPTYLPGRDELSGLGRHTETAWGGLAGYSGAWRRYEIFTREYIAGLADWLEGEQARIDATDGLTVLEVGAGDGNLSYFLGRELTKRGARSRIICTDGAHPTQRHSLEGQEILQLLAEDAVTETRPHVVLESWMPMGVDLSRHFRDEPSVQSYVLIGSEPGDGLMCGIPWETWGVGLDGCAVAGVAPYAADGFERERLDLGEQFHFRSNSSTEGYDYVSTTNIFRRISE